jgi:hypothetical protein
MTKKVIRRTRADAADRVRATLLQHTTDTFVYHGTFTDSATLGGQYDHPGWIRTHVVG